MIPGFGSAHREWMLRYPRLAAFTAMLHDESSGRVLAQSDGRPRIEYELGASDRQQLARGVRACARLLLAAGAREVLVPSLPPIVLRSEADVEAIPDAVAEPHSLPIAAAHPMSTMPLGDDPRRAVVKSTGEHHQVRGLFVLDGSIFPTSLGVPPQISIYTFARHLSRFAAERARET